MALTVSTGTTAIALTVTLPVRSACISAARPGVTVVPGTGHRATVATRVATVVEFLTMARVNPVPA